MSKKINFTCLMVMAMVIGTTLSVAGCSTSKSATGGADMSRVKLYSSTRALSDDSDLIIIAVPNSQSVAADLGDNMDFTVSNMSIVKVIKDHKNYKTGDSVVVRQLGADELTGQELSNEPQPPPVPIMHIGTQYLLYLVHSGLDGDKASQYYITGADAGLYVALHN